MLFLEKLKYSESISDLAKLLKTPVQSLTYLLYKLPSEKKYTEFKIPKSSGGERLIRAPDPRLKCVQKNLADILNNCIQEIEEKYTPRRPVLSHGFRKKINLGTKQKPDYLDSGIHTNAECHKNKRFVLNLDLANFFSSFNFGRVRGFFIKNNEFLLRPNIATIIAQIACYENELPQGSPCSPVITNILTHILDIRLTQLAKKYRCFYSRYVDDITISTNLKVFPEHLAYKVSNCDIWKVGISLEKIIVRSGFEVNPKKTRLQFNLSRQAVTGLTVNKKVNIRREYYRYARAMCHSLFNYGTFNLPGEANEANISQLEGILNHIYFIKTFGLTGKEFKNSQDPSKNNEKKNDKSIKLGAAFELYSNFLYFKHFVALEKPLVLCEGKTDIIYLKTAIKQLARRKNYTFPDINFLLFDNLSRRIMGINEGTSALENFIKHYDENTSFKFQGKKHPVIVVVDNDKEAEAIVKMLKKKSSELAKKSLDKNKTGVVYDKNKSFSYHVNTNLYLVILPLSADSERDKIEDFFDPKLLDTTIGGKTLSFKNDEGGFDNKKHYSKSVFARKVVLSKQENIDFSGFQKILELISEIINRNNSKT